MTEPAPTTTSTSTTTTTFVVGGLGTFDVGGLGPPCMPSACDLDVVAIVDRGDYIHNGKRGFLGWLLDWTQEPVTFTNPSGVEITVPATEGSVIAGVLVDIERRLVEASFPAYEISPTEYEVWFATFYFGDQPTTLEPITADFLLGVVGDEGNTLGPTGSTCNTVGQSETFKDGCGGGSSFGSATMDEWLVILAVGRAYTLSLATWLDLEGFDVDAYYAALPRLRELCVEYSTTGVVASGVSGCLVQWETFDALDYAERLVSIIKGDIADPPLPAGGFTRGSLHWFPPLVDVAGPAVVIAVEPACDECSSVVTLFESASPRMPILVLELDGAEARRLDIDTFPAVLIVDENGVMMAQPDTGEFTSEQAESLINKACVLLGGCGPVETEG